MFIIKTLLLNNISLDLTIKIPYSLRAIIAAADLVAVLIYS